MSFELTISDSNPKPVHRRKININRLARMTGYSSSHLSRVFRCEHKASIQCAQAMADVLGVTLDQMVYRIEKGVWNDA